MRDILSEIELRAYQERASASIGRTSKSRTAEHEHAAIALENLADAIKQHSPAPAYLKPYDGQAHHMAKAAQSLVLMLSGLDYSKFTLEDATRLTATFHGLIKTVEFTAKYPNLARHTVPEREESEPTIYGGRVDHSQVDTLKGERYE